MPLRTWLARTRAFLAELAANRTIRSFAIALCLVLVIGAVYHVAPVHAQQTPAPTTPAVPANPVGAGGGLTTQGALDWIAGVIGNFLQYIIKLFVGLVLFAVSMLISLAKYNDFVNAPPVTIGWVLVRDVVNMFFIVVLLIVAFSTIIGYPKEFNYKEVLPKLLLYAVLINFSKTLVGVLIDFSQVVTLTFVNGFQAAAGGNFISAFQLTKIATITPGQLADNWDLVIAELLGIAVLMAALLTIFIMLMYFLVRIVVLWYLLILSPIAFFGFALPGRLKAALGPLTGEWGKKLTAALTGGPIVAFFLWLSLAVVQSKPTYFSATMYQPSSPDEVASAAPVMTDVGQPGNLFTLIISIAMMMTGVSLAVSSSSALNDTLGGLAKSAAGSNFNPVNLVKRGASKAASTARAAPGAAVRGLASTQLAQNLATRSLSGAANLSQRNTIGGAIARGTGLVGLTGAASTAVLRQGTARQAEREKEREASLKGLSGSARLQRAQILNKSESSLLTGDKKLAGLYGVEAATIATSSAYRKQQQGNLQKQYEAENAGKVAAGTMTADASKADAKARATTDSTNAYKEALASARDTYDKAGKYDEVDKIDEIYKKDPSLYSKQEDIDKAVKSGLGDAENFFRSMKPEAMKDPRVALAIAQQGNLLKADGKTLIDDVGKNATGKWLFNEDGTSRGNRGEYLMTGITGNAPSKNFNYDSLTTNLAPQLKTDLTAALDRASLNDSKRQALAQAMNRPLDARAAEALRDSAGHLGGSNISAGSAYSLLQNGIPGAVALQVGDNGAYAAPAYGTAHSQLLDRGFQLLNDDSSLDPGNRAARLQALNAVTKGMGADMLKDANSPAAATVVDSVDKNLDALMKQVQHGDLTESQKKDVSGTFKRLQGIADANNEKIASGQALSATEQKVQTMVESRFRDPKYAATVSALTRDGSKKGKKGGGGSSGGGSPTRGGGSAPTRGGGGAAAVAGAAAAGAVAATVINRSGGGGGGGASGGGGTGPTPSGGSGVRAASAPTVAAPSAGIAAATAASRPQATASAAQTPSTGGLTNEQYQQASASLDAQQAQARATADAARAQRTAQNAANAANLPDADELRRSFAEQDAAEATQRQTPPAPTPASPEAVASATQALKDRFENKPNGNRPGRGGNNNRGRR